MKRLVNLIGAITIAAGVLLAVAATAITSAGAASTTVEVAAPGTVTRGDPGQVFELAVFHPPVASFCDVTVVTENNPSIHPDTDLIISTRDQAILFQSIEDAPGQVSTTRSVLFGRVATVLLRLGPDGVASGGITLTLDCEDPPPVTTTTPSPIVPPCRARLAGGRSSSA